MGDLIFMMWLVDVVSVSNGMGLSSIVGFVLLAAWMFLSYVESDVKAPSKWLFVIPIMLGLTAWLMPSKQTLYAAIALKAGSEIAESRLGTKAIDALEGVLDEVIAKQESKK